MGMGRGCRHGCKLGCRKNVVALSAVSRWVFWGDALGQGFVAGVMNFEPGIGSVDPSRVFNRVFWVGSDLDVLCIRKCGDRLSWKNGFVDLEDWFCRPGSNCTAVLGSGTVHGPARTAVYAEVRSHFLKIVSR